MFRAAYRLSSGAPKCICSLWFICPYSDRPLSRLGNGQRPVTTCVYKPEAANTVWSSWWRAVCRSKHAKPSINFGIINSITRLYLVGYFYWYILRCTDPWISSFGRTYVHTSITTNWPHRWWQWLLNIWDFSLLPQLQTGQASLVWSSAACPHPQRRRPDVNTSCSPELMDTSSL
jgi:hypothetical protein